VAGGLGRLKTGDDCNRRARQQGAAPSTTAGFARMVERAGVEAKLGFKAHPHNEFSA
jgi:hypothetical protein